MENIYIENNRMKQFKTQKDCITERNSIAIKDYLTDIGRTQRITPEEEADLASRARRNDIEARNKLIMANAPFVVTVAKQYQHRGIPLEDLINEGNIGLITAAEKFDETRGFKFISYAVWWIRQRILQAIGEYGRMVRIPFNQLTIIGRINKGIIAFRNEYERDPSPEELVEILNLSERDIQSAMVAQSTEFSINAPISDDGESTMEDVMAQDNVAATDDCVMKESMLMDILHVMKSVLKDREFDIISMVFGLDGYEHSYEEIAASLNITRERVRQIKEKAVNKLRHNERTEVLLAYI